MEYTPRDPNTVEIRIKQTLKSIDDFIKDRALKGRKTKKRTVFAHLIPDRIRGGQHYTNAEVIWKRDGDNTVCMRFTNLLSGWTKAGYLYKDEQGWHVNPAYLPDYTSPTTRIVDEQRYVQSALDPIYPTALALLKDLALKRPMAQLSVVLDEIAERYKELLERPAPQPQEDTPSFDVLRKAHVDSLIAYANEGSSRIELKDISLFDAAQVLVPFGQTLQKAQPTPESTGDLLDSDGAPF